MAVPLLWAGVIPMALLVQWFKTMLGMGWGTVLSPVLLALSFERESVVVSLLLAEFTTSVCSATLHFIFKNVHLRARDEEKESLAPASPIAKGPADRAEAGPAEASALPKPRFMTRDLAIVLILGIVGALGAVISTIVSAQAKQSKHFKFAIKLYIGIVILIMAVAIAAAILLRRRASGTRFAWWKIVLLAVWSGFNKGISGGGSGPIVVTGLMLSGVPERHSIGVTPFSEILVCGVGSICYLVSNLILEGAAKTWTYYKLVPALLIGALPVIPFAAMTTKKVNKDHLKVFVAVFTLLLGLFSIIQTSLDYTKHWPKIKTS
eukprot:m51a1_g2295 hypothetical protein (321) ;mRNA; r:419787-420961